MTTVKSAGAKAAPVKAPSVKTTAVKSTPVRTGPDEATFFCISARDGSSSHPFGLVDRSAGGARLLVDNPNDVPETFTLVQRGPVAVLWKCRVAWRTETQIGVTFEERRATST
jgi:hypothetical protein